VRLRPLAYSLSQTRGGAFGYPVESLRDDCGGTIATKRSARAREAISGRRVHQGQKKPGGETEALREPPSEKLIVGCECRMVAMWRSGLRASHECAALWYSSEDWRHAAKPRGKIRATLQKRRDP